MRKHYYCLYGLVFESVVQLYNIPELDADDGIKADVKVKKGIISDYFEVPKDCDFFKDQHHIYADTNYAKFLISDGCQVIMECPENADEKVLAARIIGAVLTFVLFQRGYSAIHCTALEFDGKGVLVAGASGAGKSTTATNLIKRGHKYLCDDVAMISPDNGFFINPGFPIQKVCQDVAEGIEKKENLLFIDENREKYSYYNPYDYCDRPVPLTTIIVLKKTEKSQVEVNEYKGLDSFFRVLENLYMNFIYIDKGIPEEDKFRCLKIASQARVFAVSRPLGQDTTEEIVNIIEDIVRGE